MRHLWNPDLVRLWSLMCRRTWPLVTYYYSFSCCSKYWFIKGFSIWASWRPVKYHYVWRSERRDREGGGQVRSLKRGEALPHSITISPLILIYLFNSEAQQHFYQLGAIEHIVSSCFFTLNFEVVLFISAGSFPVIPVHTGNHLLICISAHSWMQTRHSSWPGTHVLWRHCQCLSEPDVQSCYNPKYLLHCSTTTRPLSDVFFLLNDLNGSKHQTYLEMSQAVL